MRRTADPFPSLVRPSIPAALLVLAAAACAGGDRGTEPPRWTGRVDTVEGVVLVENPAEPLYPARRVRVEERWSHSLEEWVGTRRSWEQPPLVRLGDGTAYVLAPQTGRLLLFGTGSGELRESIGPPEGSPGHLDEPLGLATFDGGVAVGERYGLEVFDRDGRFRRRIDIAVRDSQLDRVLQLHRLDSASVLTLESAGGAPSWRRRRPTGEVSALPRPEAVSRRFSGATERQCWRIAEGPTGPLLASCFYPVTLSLDSAGRAAREVVIDRGADSASRSELEHLRRESRARWEAWKADLPEEGIRARVERDLRLHAVKDQYRAVRYDRSSGLVGLLEETPEYMGGGDARLHLFDGKGVYLARLPFPDYWLDFDLDGSTAYAVTRDGEGERWFRSYRLVLPREPGVRDSTPWEER